MEPNIVPATAHFDRKVTVGSRVIAANQQEIFDLLADPSQHATIDGSDTVLQTRDSSPERLYKGARFGMNMKMMVPYIMSSTVSEFEEPSLIEWHHFGGHRWRYELEPAGKGTRVTESFDWGRARIPAKLYEAVGYPDRHRASIDRTLERIERHFADRP